MQRLPATRSYWKAIIIVVLAISVLTCKENAELREVAPRSEQVYKQYRTGDYPTAKAALLGFIRDLEGRLSDSSNPNAETYKADIVLSYARLAKLEEKNNGSEKEIYMQKAIANCQQQKIKRSCSAQELRAQVDAADALPLK